MKTYISKSEKDTIEFAKDFASKLKKDDIIVLNRWFRCTEKQSLQKEYLSFLV